MWLIALVIILAAAVVVLTVVVAQRVRLERQRSEARIAALASAIDDPLWETPWATDGGPDESFAFQPAVSLVAPDVTRPSRSVAFAAAALVVLGASTLLFLGLNSGSGAPRAVTVTAAAPKAPSIELVSMRHAIDGQTLIVSGLVRNPTGSATPALSAIVSVLGQEGQVVARGESQLDPTVLEPGKETTFRVSVPEITDPGRYRLAFMNGNQIVPHVDRRSDLARTALANTAHGN